MSGYERANEKFVFIQLNFWEGRCYYPIVSFLQREQPHIFSVQELLTSPKLLIPSSMTQEALLQQDFFEQVAEGKSRFGLARRTCSFDQRCATFTRDKAAINASHQIDLVDLDSIEDELEREKSAYCGLLHSVVALQGGGFVHVLNHHEKVVIDGRVHNKGAELNFRKIADYIATLEGPVILSGDFNLYKEAPALLQLQDVGLKNLNDVYGIESARNELSWKPEECVSHVFVNDHIMVHDYHVAPDIVSDHQPLVLHFSIAA